MTYSRCRQINLHGLETAGADIGNAAPARLVTSVLLHARILERGADGLVIIAAGDKAASSQNDVIKRTAVDGNLQKSVVKRNCGAALLKVVVLPEDQLRTGAIGYGRRVQFLVAAQGWIINERRIWR